MTNEEIKKEKCDCSVEYDENHLPIHHMCKKHREEEEERLGIYYHIYK